MASRNVQEPVVLTSWKEVACYLGKGVRTVQRWEKNDGLPIRRISGASKIVVRREDLDAWLRSQPGQSGGLRSETLGLVEANIQLSRELRQKSAQLRHSMSAALHELMNECQQMHASLASVATKKAST